MMKSIIGFMSVIIFCTVSITVAGESRLQHQYTDIETVKSWIEPPEVIPMSKWTPEGASFVEISIMRSGDKVGTGIARAYPRADLLYPDRLERVLTLIRLSFSAPEIIVQKEDKNPKFTMLLLFALKHECKDMNLRQRIIDAEMYIDEQLAKSDKKTE